MHPQSVRLTFDVRTRSERALVLYNSGRLQSHDFIALEVIDGNLKLTLNKGNGLSELLHRRKINDGLWHQIEILISPLDIKLGIDGHRKDKQTSFGENRFLDLHGYLYIGGLSFLARSKAVLMGLESLVGSQSAGGSIVGCVQNFKVNGVRQGFREAEVTRDLRPECLYTFPCTANDPCINGAQCVEEGYYHYQCECDGPASCYKSGGTGGAGEDGDGMGNSGAPTMRADVIHVQDIVVREGARTFITTSNINLQVSEITVLLIIVQKTLIKICTPPFKCRKNMKHALNLLRHTKMTGS
jgi:chondroitin sulfate proteoglycan 4